MATSAVMPMVTGALAASVGQRSRLGTQQSLALASRERVFARDTAGAHAHQHHDDTQSRCSSNPGRSPCPFSNPPTDNIIRRYPEHFCAFEGCCYKFSNEGALLGKNFHHLPVCHAYCWKYERDRLEKNAVQTDNWSEVTRGLPLCHRHCYMKALLSRQRCDIGDKEVVPRNRSIAERLRMPHLEHAIQRILDRRERAAPNATTNTS